MQENISLPQINDACLLTHSRATCFKTCPKMHFLRYEMGVRKIRKSKPLRIGGAVHEGLDVHARGGSISDAINAAIAVYDETPEWIATEEDVYAWAIERVTVGVLVEMYFAHWGDSRVEVIESEVDFKLPIVNPSTNRTTPTFLFAGKRDKIVRLNDGRLAIREHKTCSEDLSLASDYWLRLVIDQQISGYYLSAIQSGIDVRTVEYDVIRKPQLRPSRIPLTDAEGLKIVVDKDGNRAKNKNGTWRQAANSSMGLVLQTRPEEPEEFADRIRQDISSRIDHYFARKEIPRLKSDLDEFQHELWQIQKSIREAQRTGRWYRNTAACRQYGNPCEYFAICTGGCDVTQGELVDGYEIVDRVHEELDFDDSTES